MESTDSTTKSKKEIQNEMRKKIQKKWRATHKEYIKKKDATRYLENKEKMNKQRVERARRQKEREKELQKERENDMKLGETIENIDFDNYVSSYKTNNNSLVEEDFSDIHILEKRKQNDEETLSELERKKKSKTNQQIEDFDSFYMDNLKEFDGGFKKKSRKTKKHQKRRTYKK